MSLEPGTLVKIKKTYLKWLSRHADELYDYPNGIKPIPEGLKKYLGDLSIADQLSEYFTHRYSYDRNKELYGVIIQYSENADYYLIDCENELGRSIQYFDRKDFKVIK